MIPMDFDNYELQERIAKATEQAKHELKQRKANNDN